MVIEVSGVTKSFGNLLAVDRGSFSVDRGEAAALLGINGAGKSTLIKCILGLLDYSGSISIDGRDIKDNPKLAKSLIGYVPQEPLLYDMKTRDILLFFGSIRRVEKGRIDEVLALTGLTEHESKSTSELSGGMRQSLSFAIALLSEPPVLILDEPTSNLDAQARTDFLNLVSAYKDAGKTVLFSSHRLDEVDLLADRALFMKAGRVIFEDRPGNLGETLGLKVKINLVIPESSIEEAQSLLLREGFAGVTRNGRGLNIEIESTRRIAPFKKLLESNIQVLDFTIDEPSMEGLISQIETNGY
jgi:ABC-type multidrug transport system ATPase subunit